MDAPRYENLTALLVNCSLTPDPARSHTGRLLDVVDHLMSGAGVTVDRLHAVGHDIAPGVQPDMREHGWETDEWPDLWPRVQAADILVLGTPIWLGEESSVCRRVVERQLSLGVDALPGGSGMLICIEEKDEDRQHPHAGLWHRCRRRRRHPQRAGNRRAMFIELFAC